MSTVRPARTAAICCVVLTVLAVVYAGSGAIASWQPSWGYLLQALIHLGELAGVLAVALLGAAGRGRLGRIGLGAAVVGQLMLAVAEITYNFDESAGDALFNVAPELSGVGLILAGIAVLRARRWSGWHRCTPLLVGVYTFAVLAPATIVSGGPPAPGALLAIGGWDVCWALVGLSALAEIRAGRPSDLPAGTAVDARPAGVSAQAAGRR